MAGPTETPTKGTGDSGAESPTTVRPLDMDDDDVQDGPVLTDNTNQGTTTGVTKPETTKPETTKPETTKPETTKPETTDAPASTEAAAEETAPQKPPRPISEAQKNEQTLKEAFPSVDIGVIKAVLSASRGKVEPAFNALLEMTDPDAVKNEPAEEEAAPPQPPRPTGQRQMSQLEADELYARQLAEHYDNVGAYESRTSNRQQSRQQPRRRADDAEEREYSFMEDDLPVIRDNLRQGFQETQTTVNKWISTLKQRIEENFDETEDQQHQGQRPGEPSRRSGDYDADPQVLGDDFAGMRLGSDGTPQHRAGTQTGVYRPPSHSPRPNDGRRVGFKEETEEINMYETSPQVPPKDTPPASKASKWQPLSTVEPSPIGDNDPFSLGDSEDEKDNNKETKDSTDKNTKDKPSDEDSERLKKAAAEAMEDSLVEPGKDDGSKSTKP